jgi:aminomethyltransferase
MLKRTPLFEAHQRLGGKLIEFGGWEMPVQYTSISDEHHCVRKAAGVFDISHMGEVFVTGDGAEAFLNATLTNDVRKLAVGLGQYTLMCNEQGGVVDDLYVYHVAPGEYLLIINASRIDADWAWLQARHKAFPDVAHVTMDQASDRFAAIAIQGPKVAEFIDKVLPGPSLAGTAATLVTDLKKNQVGEWMVDGQRVYVGRTGYTGEDGFEIIAPKEIIADVFERVLEIGKDFGARPAGLGARDTLRTEACFPLYGHELDEQTTPIEAGVGFFVSLDKGDFVGRSVLAEQKAKGVAKRCIAFKMVGACPPPRPGYQIVVGGENVGSVVSGTQSPSLSCGIGLGYVAPALAEPGTAIEIEIRGRKFPAEVIKKPFYRKA